MDQLESRHPFDNDSVMAQYWGVPQYARSLEELLVMWQKLAINEIQANLGVQLKDPYKQPTESKQGSVSQEYALQWAIRRVQEASCINDGNRNSQQREKWGHTICAKLKTYQNQLLIPAESQCATCVAFHMAWPSDSTRERLQQEKDLLQHKLDSARSTRAKTRYREREQEIRLSVEKGTSPAFRMLKNPQPLYQAKVDMGETTSQCIHMDIKRQAASWRQLWDYQGSMGADVVITKRMGIKCPAPLSAEQIRIASGKLNPQLFQLTSCIPNTSACCPCMPGKLLPGCTLPSSWQGTFQSKKGKWSLYLFQKVMGG